MNCYNASTDPYKFDLDYNDFPALTENNVKRINFLIENDSNYRSDMDPNNADSTYNYIKNHPNTMDKNEILEIVKKIDKQNSTHQASQGPSGGSNGREITADYIIQIKDFYDRILKEDPELVNDLAGAIPTRYTFSFASKYCTYISRYMFDKDGYSIYDKIVCDILPYYAWVYCKDKYKGRTRSNIDKIFGEKNKGNYKGYRDLIDSIRSSSKKINGYEISREDFDHLLWYYFKGDVDIKGNNKKIIYESRITEAMKLVGDKSIVFI